MSSLWEMKTHANVYLSVGLKEVSQFFWTDRWRHASHKDLSFLSIRLEANRANDQWDNLRRALTGSTPLSPESLLVLVNRRSGVDCCRRDDGRKWPNISELLLMISCAWRDTFLIDRFFPFSYGVRLFEAKFKTLWWLIVLLSFRSNIFIEIHAKSKSRLICLSFNSSVPFSAQVHRCAKHERNQRTASDSSHANQPMGHS